MATYRYEVNKLKYLDIGQEGETGATIIEIDMREWVEELYDMGYESPCFHVLFMPYNGTVPLEGAAVWTAATGSLSWEITAAITSIAGKGYTEIRGFDHTGGLVKKTRIIPTSVNESVSGVEGGIPPAPYDDWLNQILILEDQLNDALSNPVVEYAVTTTYNTHPAEDSSDWSRVMPDITAHKGEYLWKKTVLNWSTGASTVTYDVSYLGMDGDGSVDSVNGKSGVVVLDGDDIQHDSEASNEGSLSSVINTKLDASMIVYGDEPLVKVEGMIWLKPKAVS